MRYSPCKKDCLNRSIEPNCHTFCAAYLEWKDWLDDFNQKVKEAKGDKSAEDYFHDRNVKIERIKHHKGDSKL